MALATRLVLGTLIAGAVTLSAQPTFRGGIDLATFGVTVLDRKNELVTDLTKDDFEVLEDGRPQRVDFFARGDGDRSPDMHVGLMLDASGSMAMDLKLARSAAIRFLNLLPEAQDVTLVDFDTQVRITKYPQRDFPRLIERIAAGKAPTAVRQLRALVKREQQAHASGDRRRAVRLSGDFHVLLAELSGSSILARLMRELTPLTCLAILTFEAPTAVANTSADDSSHRLREG